MLKRPKIKSDTDGLADFYGGNVGPRNIGQLRQLLKKHGDRAYDQMTEREKMILRKRDGKAKT